MTRTIEVGRAVLASSTHRLELWLTTLITISPSQHSIDIQQLSSHAIVSLLSSGKVWVGRGNGMRVEIQMTLRGEPLPPQQLQELTNSILSAPVWTQLNLRPTLPAEAMPLARTVYININHCNRQDASEEREQHRIFSNVPAADVKPPQSVPSFRLQDVRFSMDVLEQKMRPLSKRPKILPVGRSASSGQTESQFDQEGNVDIILQKIAATTGMNSTGEDSAAPRLSALPNDRKRRRSGKPAHTKICSSPTLSSNSDLTLRRTPATMIDPPSSAQSKTSKEELAGIQLMADGAMRLSIYGHYRTSNGLKVKANTFGVGLADVAPALWRPGFIVALSQRARVLPTITRSFGQVAEVRVTSVSLSEKVKQLSAFVSSAAHRMGHTQAPAPDEGLGMSSSSISGRLWLHLQRTLVKKLTPPLQAFMAHNGEATNHSDSDEILDHEELAQGVKFLDVFGIDNCEAAVINDNSMAHVRMLVASPSARTSQTEHYENRNLWHQGVTTNIENELLIKRTPMAEMSMDDDRRNGNCNLMQRHSEALPYSSSSMLNLNNVKSKCRGSLDASMMTEQPSLDPDEHALSGLVTAEQSVLEDLLFNDCGETEQKVECPL